MNASRSIKISLAILLIVNLGQLATGTMSYLRHRNSILMLELPAERAELAAAIQPQIESLEEAAKLAWNDLSVALGEVLILGYIWVIVKRASITGPQPSPNGNNGPPES